MIRLRSGEAGQDDLDALELWQRESPAHKQAFAEASEQWSLLRLAACGLTASKTQKPQDPYRALASNALSRRAWLGGTIAASMGGAYLAIRPPLDLWPSLSELGADYRTATGERRQIAFADQISVEMNTRTSLASGAGAGARQIELIDGEIAVKMGLGESSLPEPFVVVAGDGRTSAVRALVDLHREGQIVSVICLEGEVKVECRRESATLKARQRITYDANGLGDMAATDGRVVEAWRQGLLVFENKPLSEVVPEINRYRRGRIVLMNDRIGRLPLDATFRLDHIEEVVPKLAYLFSLKVRLLPGGLVFLS